MTKAQALNLMVALEGARVSASAVMTFAGGVTESWAVQLDPATVYTGEQLAALTSYCAAQGLEISAIVSQLGIV